MRAKADNSLVHKCPLKSVASDWRQNPIGNPLLLLALEPTGVRESTQCVISRSSS